MSSITAITDPIHPKRARNCKSSPTLNRAIVLPLEGKGDRSAVDEVTCRPAPLRGAFAPMCEYVRKWELSRRTFEVSPNLERAKAFPYEGKGDRVSGG